MRFKGLCLMAAATVLLGFINLSFAALLGNVPSFPQITFLNPLDGTIYNAGTNLLGISAAPVAIRLSASTPPRFINPTGNPASEVLSIMIEIDETGSVVGGVAGDDFTLVGQVDLDGNGSIDAAGVLLTGEVVEFGFSDSGGPTDSYDFRFTITGGLLAYLFQGQELGATVISENSTFVGVFPVNFSGRAKGTLGGIPLHCTGTIGDFVWHDQDHNGIQDAGEPGLNGVTVNLRNPANNNLIATTTTGANNSPNGYYQFTGLCRGDYRVEVSTPAGFSPTQSQAPNSTAATDSNGSPASVTLPTDHSSDQTIDFGFESPCTGTIGDFVWHDQNHNGIQDAGEPGINGVTVSLRDPNNNTPIATAITGANGSPNGYYQFTGLCAGDYKVEVVIPSGYTPTDSQAPGSTAATDSNDSPTNVTLPDDNSSDQTIDFGFETPCTGMIGDFVWHDLDHDGRQDASEPGINGVTVNLHKLADNSLMATTTTGGPGSPNGYYQFTGLCKGAYKVEVVTPSGFAPTPSQAPGSTTATDSNGSPANVTLTADNSADQTIDFGFESPCTGTIGDFVWHDLDRDGIQEASEPGLSGVTVTLRQMADNSLIATTTTNANGYYQFTGLCMGNYRVEVNAPLGFTPTDSHASGSTAATDSNSSPADVTLPADDSSDQTIDFGFESPCIGTIGNFVWHDLNHNGIQDTGEPGINGVTVNLRDMDDNTLIATTTTGANGAPNGYYQFTGLCWGDYRVEIVTPSGFAPTSSHVPGSTLDNDSNSSPANVTLPDDNSSDQTIDFGFETPCTGMIGDFVWHDLDRDGIQDSCEPGINGVTVNLRKLADNSLIATTTTGPNGSTNGYYQFTGLCKGDYKVEVLTPSGFAPTQSYAPGSTSSNDSNGSPANVTLSTDNSSNQTIDFGFKTSCTGSIGDFVWHDLDHDGRQDSGEPGLSGVKVNLRNPVNYTLIATTTTNSNGFYEFPGLCAGKYKVEVVTPSGFTPTTSNVGTNDTMDSDGSPVVVTLSTNSTHNTTIDFGFKKNTSSHEGCSLNYSKSSGYHGGSYGKYSWKW